MSLLPERPFKVRSSYISSSVMIVLLATLAGAACLVGGAVWQGGSVSGLLAEKRIWATGRVAPEVRVSGKVVTRQFMFKEYRLDVQWRDEANAAHTSLVEFDTLFSGVNKNQDPELHYDPAVPGAIALNWAHDVEGGRWASAAVFMAVFLVMGGALLAVGWGRLRSLRDAKRCGLRSQEVALAVTAVEEVLNNGRPTGHRRYKYRLDGSTLGVKDQNLAVQFHTSKGEQPLFTDSACTHLLGLWSPELPERPVVLRSDGYPYDLAESVQQEIAARIAAAKPARG